MACQGSVLEGQGWLQYRTDALWARKDDDLFLPLPETVTGIEHRPPVVPQRCTKLPPDQLAQATALKVHLFGSLSATGKGHGTERAGAGGARR